MSEMVLIVVYQYEPFPVFLIISVQSILYFFKIPIEINHIHKYRYNITI